MRQAGLTYGEPVHLRLVFVHLRLVFVHQAGLTYGERILTADTALVPVPAAARTELRSLPVN